jgi:hypothetical protein
MGVFQFQDNFMDSKLQQPFAANSAAYPFDTITIKRAFNRLG